MHVAELYKVVHGKIVLGAGDSGMGDGMGRTAGGEDGGRGRIGGAIHDYLSIMTEAL